MDSVRARNLNVARIQVNIDGPRVNFETIWVLYSVKEYRIVVYPVIEQVDLKV